MSPPDDDPDYKVGPGHPPLQHRFVKGLSGNPNGRPRKAKREAADVLSWAELILAESKRLLSLTEGGERVTLPARQGVFRAMLVTAGKGNAHAQVNYLKQVWDAEAREQKVRSEALSNALRMKFHLEDLRDEWVAAGRAEMSMPVHPSDIEINGLSGEVKYFLALTDEQRNLRVRLLDDLSDGHAFLARSVATIAEDGDDPFLRLGRDLAVIKIHFANELLPSRLRRSVPPEFTVSAKTARRYLNCEWAGAERLRATMARKLGAGQ